MIESREAGNDLVVTLSGRIDGHQGTSMEIDLKRLMELHPEANVIINFHDVEFLSSSGMRVLITTNRMLKEVSKELRLCNLSPAVQKVLHAAELDKLFHVFETEQEAIESL